MKGRVCVKMKDRDWFCGDSKGRYAGEKVSFGDSSRTSGGNKHSPRDNRGSGGGDYGETVKTTNNRGIPKGSAFYDYPSKEILGTAGDTQKDKDLPAQSKQAANMIRYIDQEDRACWGSNALHGKKVINLSNTGMQDFDIENVAYKLRSYNFNLDAALLNNNNLGDKGIGAFMNGITHQGYQTLYSKDSGWNPFTSELKVTQSVVYLNFSNTNMGDQALNYIANALAKLNNTKVIDVSGNPTTPPGESIIAKAMQSKYVQDLIVKTRKIHDMSKALSGNKEEKKMVYKYCIQLAKERGVYEDHVVVKKGYEKIWSVTKDGAESTFGLIKCLVVPESLIAYAKGKFQGKMIAMLPKTAAKTVGKAIDVEDKVSCFLDFSEDLCTSKSGVEAIKQELCIMGETEFCNDQ